VEDLTDDDHQNDSLVDRSFLELEHDEMDHTELSEHLGGEDRSELPNITDRLELDNARVSLEKHDLLQGSTTGAAGEKLDPSGSHEERAASTSKPSSSRAVSPIKQKPSPSKKLRSPGPRDQANMDHTSCPICGKDLHVDNIGLNEHIDYCLSRGAIKQSTSSVSEDTPSGKSPGKEKAQARNRHERPLSRKKDSASTGQLFDFGLYRRTS
jgi:hypothetical protein